MVKLFSSYKAGRTTAKTFRFQLYVFYFKPKADDTFLHLGTVRASIIYTAGVYIRGRFCILSTFPFFCVCIAVVFGFRAIPWTDHRINRPTDRYTRG